MTVKVTNKKTIAPILLLYFLMVVIVMAINGFGRFNSVPVLFFCLVWICYIRDSRYYLWSLFLSLILSIFSLANGVSLLHICVDILDLSFVLGAAYLCNKFRYSRNIIRFASLFMALLLIFSIIGMGFSRLYEYSDGAYRYNGIFASGNSSSNTFLVLSIMFWEFFKRIRLKGLIPKLVLVLLVLAFLAYVFTSQTRSMLIALPYWMYQFALLFGKKKVLALAILVGLAGSTYLLTVLQEKLRMTEDASFLTRLQLYEAELSGIWDNYIVIPHGAHRAWELAIDVTMDDGFSPHNDFLKYLYDWGLAFILLLYVLYKNIKNRVGFDLNICLFLLAQSSCLLHNMWFLPIVWLPVLFVLNLKNNILYEQNVSSCKKI